MKNLDFFEVKELNSSILIETNGGGTVLTYDIKDNYDAAAENGETLGTFLYGFAKGLFRELFS